MSIIEILQQIFSATDEQTTAFSEAMKTNGIYTTAHENMDVRYPKMKANFETSQRELGEAKNRMAEMQTAAEAQANLQAQLEQAQAQLAQERLNSAIKVGLLSEKAVDVDYLTFKLNEKVKADGEALTLDDNGNIKGWKDKLEGLKTQFPNQFEAGGNGDGYEVYKPNSLRKADGTPDGKAMTKEQFDKLGYSGKVQLRQENPELYNQMTKG